ncbi:MAG: hypothetical protein QOH88_3621 [Verrucomicrobiota bacterium]|jgi:hypothetical protein
MCNVASLFRILVAVSVILPFADSIAQTSPTPAEDSTPSASHASPDKKWEFVDAADEPKLRKADTKEVVLDLGEPGVRSVLWAPDSKRFAVSYGRKSEARLYQLRDGQWVELESPDKEAYEQADAAVAAEAKKQGVPKTSGRTPWWSIRADKWVQATTLVMHVSLRKLYQWGEDHEKDLSRDFLFTLKFDAAGKWKIVKMRQLSEKEAEAKQKEAENKQ